MGLQIGLYTLLFLGVLLLAAVVVDARDSQVQEDAILSTNSLFLSFPPVQTSIVTLAPTPPVQTQPKPLFCDHEDVTSAVAQRLGAPLNSLNISSMVRLDSRYIAIYLLNTFTIDLYMYDLGNDGHFNTADDTGFLVEANVHTYQMISPLLSAQTLYWATVSNPSTTTIKKCTLTSQGCANTQLVTTITGVNILQGMVLSPPRLYLVYQDYFLSVSIFASCSLQSGNTDSCNNGQTSFITHLTLPGNVGHLRKTLPDVGFVYYLYSLNQETLFTVLPSTGPMQVALPLDVDKYSLSSRLTSVLLGLQSTPLDHRLVLIDPMTGALLGTVDTISSSPPSIILYFVDATSSAFFSVYTLNQPQARLQQKRSGAPAVSLFSNLNYNPYPLLLLPDGTVLALNQANGNKILRSLCVP